MKAPTKDLRLHTQELLAAADRGETVIITYRGRCRAALKGWREMPEPPDATVRNPGFGLWADRSEDVDAEVRRLREPRRFDRCWSTPMC